MKTRNNLKAIRRERGLTQYELAARLGTYQTRIWQLEQGYYPPKTWEKEALAAILKVEELELFPSS